MGNGTLFLLLAVYTSFVMSSQLNYIKTEVYKSTWIPGETLEKIRLTKECSRLCQVAYNCTAFHHDRCFKICELGQKDGLVSASQPSEETTTVYIQPVNWKLLVAGDYTTLNRSVEVINFKSNTSVCSKLPDYPSICVGCVGGLVDRKTPMVCGVRDAPNQCYNLESGNWQQGATIKRGRYHFAGMPFSPFHNSSHKFFIVGGYGPLTTEVLTDSGWETTQTILPFEVYVPCSRIPVLDEDTFLVLGGYYALPNTLMFSPSKNVWTMGPPMAIGRYGFGCGRLPTKEKSSQLSIIVAGGYYRGPLDSVEILDSLTTGWRFGPKLPKPNFGCPMVEHPNGGVIYIIDTFIYYLAHAGPSAQWQLLPQKLAVARSWFLAFFVPDEVASCT